MRILIVHNFYGSAAPSGENAVVHDQVDSLRSAHHDVYLYSIHSDFFIEKGLLGKLYALLVSPFNVFSLLKVWLKISRFKPDIVHVHNTFPFISPSIFYVPFRRVPFVMTLHNYRLFCPAAIPLRGSSVCTECIDTRSVWSSLLYRCYRRSLIATVPVSLTVSLHRWLGTWEKRVDAFICLSQTQRQLVVDGGLNANKVHVLYNSVFMSDANNPPVLKSICERDYNAVYIGRLSDEKGIRTLIEAWNDPGLNEIPLHIYGDGPLRNIVEGLGKNNIIYKGKVDHKSCVYAISRARMLIMPSLWFEGFPIVLLSAIFCRTPILASRIGTLAEIIEEYGVGFLFETGSPESLRSAIMSHFNSLDKLSICQSNAASAFKLVFGPHSSMQKLVKLYRSVISNFNSTLSAGV